MSCNGCRVLRKGCSESCILRRCLQSIESAEAQGHATVFVAKFFGRAGLMSFISAVPEQQRSALFQSLLYEACGRTVNPVSGAVGLLWTGNWHVCQTAVETVLRGGTLRALSEIPSVVLMPESDETSVAEEQSTYRVEKVQDPYRSSKSFSKRKGFQGELAISKASKPFNLDLSLTSGFPAKTQAVGTHRPENRRPATPSFNSEGSVTTCFETAGDQAYGADSRTLRCGFFRVRTAITLCMVIGSVFCVSTSYLMLVYFVCRVQTPELSDSSSTRFGFSSKVLRLECAIIGCREV